MSAPDPNVNDPVEPSRQASPPAELDEKLARIEREIGERRRDAAQPRVLHIHLRYPGLYLLFILVNILDLVVTRIALDQFGMNEANIAAKGILIRFGFVGFTLYKLFLTGLVVALAEIISRTKPRWAFLLIFLGSVAVGMVVVLSLGHLIGFMMGRPDVAAVSNTPAYL